MFPSIEVMFLFKLNTLHESKLDLCNHKFERPRPTHFRLPVLLYKFRFYELCKTFIVKEPSH